MWKRFNRPTEKAIGNPTLVETTLDERSASGLNNIHNGTISPTSGSRTVRNRGEDVVKELPSLPTKSVQAAQPSNYRPYSTASSAYSQPAADVRQKHPRLEIPRASSIYPDDVSPPDSPRTGEGARSRKSSPNISPITESDRSSRNMYSNSRPYVSNIPLPRAQQNPAGAAAFISGWREKIGRDDSPAREARSTRWDDFSGEPSDTGKPAQAIPGTTQFDQQQLLRSNNKMGNSVEVSGGEGLQPKPLFGHKIRTVGRKGSAVKTAGSSTETREEWKGASGRTTIVKPLKDKPLPPGKTATFPQGKGAASLVSESRSGGTSPAPVVKVSARASNDTSTVPALPLVDATIRPVVPLKVGRNSPHSPIARAPPPQRPNLTMDMTSPLARNPSDEHMRDSSDKQTFSSPLEASPEIPTSEKLETQLHDATKSLQIRNEPASRFSATTYNTTVPDSPPDSPLSLDNPPPLPTPPLSVLNRKRPIPTSNNSGTKTPTRKPTPSELTNSLDGSKQLPQSPPDAEPVDRVAQLEATLNSLNRRRGNLQTVIHELTHVVQPSSIAYDMASRQEIKRTVEGLNVESASVAKEIYETGMKLHRAMKRRDEKSMFEPTGLWVRRVTE